jgi:predicted  nucleic acid-binding Zn-ribbon protein
MERQSDSNLLKQDLSKAAEQLRALRDEIRVHLHLANMELKETWDNKLQPELAQLEAKLGDVSEATRSKARELVKRMTEMRDRLKTLKAERGAHS